MGALEENLAEIIKERKVSASAVSKETGISYMRIYDSIFNRNRNRPLRGDELIAICKYLKISPMDIGKKEK